MFSQYYLERKSPLCLSLCPSLVPTVNVLLLEAEDDGPEVVVVGEVVPVLRPVKVLLVRLVLH